MPPPLGGSSGGCPAVWSISHHKGYCSRFSTVQPPHLCGLSCGATLPGRRPSPGLCTGSPVTGCFHGPRCSLAGLGPVALEYRSCPWPAGSAMSPRCVQPMGCWFFPVPRPLYVCGVPGLLAPFHRCARAVCCSVSAVSRVTQLLFIGAPARCGVLRVRCPGPLGSSSPVCPLGVLCCVCGVLGHLAFVRRCACSVICFACAVSRATWLLFTGVPALSFVLFVRCPGPLGSPSPVCPLGVLFCVCGVLGFLAPVHRSARPWCPVPSLPSVHARVRCPGPRGARSSVCALCAVRVCHWWLYPSPSPPNFFSFFLK